MSEPQQFLIPDTLFKYVDAKGGLATLEGETVSVMFSKPSDLNDPFECLPSLNGLSCDPSEFGPECKHLASPVLSANADYWRQEIELHWFVTSFTQAERNVRMWAQYGKDHKGMSITFDLSKAPLSPQKEMMRKVCYEKEERFDISDFSQLSVKEAGERLKQIATQKGRDWEHEKEFRWFLRDEGGDQANTGQQPYSKRLVDGKMRAFMKLPHSCIKRVTIGYLSHPSLLRSVLELRKMHQAHWEVARATLSVSSFQFEEELVNKD